MTIEDFAEHKARAEVDRAIAEIASCSGARVLIVADYTTWAVVDVLTDQPMRLVIDPRNEVKDQIRSAEAKLKSGARLDQGESLLLAAASGVLT